MKKIWNFLESFKRKLKFLVSRTKTSWKLEEKMKNNSKEFKRNKIKLIKLKKNRKKEKF